MITYRGEPVPTPGQINLEESLFKIRSNVQERHDACVRSLTDENFVNRSVDSEGRGNDYYEGRRDAYANVLGILDAKG